MRDYYVFFSPLKLPRETVLNAAWTILSRSGLTPTLECEELKLDPAQKRYRWSGRFVTCNTTEEVFSLAREWAAIVVYFEYTVDEVLGNLSVLLWNDTTPALTTMTLCEDSTLFNYQREHSAPLIIFQDLILSLAESLGSSFCIMKSNPPLRTMDEGEMSEILEHMKSGQQLPLLLAAHGGRFPLATSLARAASAGYSARSHLGYVVLTDKEMGTPERESS
jgi:hypothetical protein